MDQIDNSYGRVIHTFICNDRELSGHFVLNSGFKIQMEILELIKGSYQTNEL